MELDLPSGGNSRAWLGPYLAGLIEGDGSIVVPDPKNMKRRPIITITFHLKDLPLAEKLRELLGGIGKINHPKVGNYVVWFIQDYDGL